ncbi:MAG: hypothetical protein AAF196_18400 [Planctomycetota bacterium]
MANQLEMPPISFARYLDLLKRRRWQVIPATIGGLLIGTLVAFVIPRYYVAKTTIAYKGIPFDRDSEEEDDEFTGVFSFANESIPDNFVEPALIQLGRIGPGTSVEERRPIIEAAQGQIDVAVFTGARDNWPRVVIEYKDEDGNLSAAFTNAIAQVWIESIVADLSASARAELDDANTDVEAAKNVVDGLITQRTGLFQRFGLALFQPSPTDRPGIQGLQLDQNIQLAIGDISTWDLELLDTQNEIRQLRARLDGVDQFLPIDARGSDVPESVRIAIATATRNAELARAAAGNFRPGTAMHAGAERIAIQAEAKLREVVETLTSATGTNLQRPNPRFKDLQRELELAESKEIQLEAKIARRERDRDALIEQRSQLPQQILEITRVNLALDTAEEDLSEKQTLRDRLQRQVDQITDRQLFARNRAVVPPAPTDPNIVIVALTGSIVGLAAAIGLVLLIDFLRSTFKTVDDVSYAIQVPILGSMAYLETAEVREAQFRTRRNVALVAGTFFALLAGVVLVYLVAPTRLPTTVADFLEGLLESPQ